MLTPASEGLFHARNRHYHPRLGRFIQRDPNETGQPLLTALAFNGQTLSILVGGFDVQSLYGDGVNLYAAFGSNPIGNNDPLGLFSYLDSLGVAAIQGELRELDAVRIRLGTALVAGVLGSVIVSGQWGVGGGLTGAGFDLFLDGIEAMISGSHALGEVLMAAGEATAAAIFASERDFAGKTVGAIIATCKKGSILRAPLPPDGPGWKEILQKTWDEIVEAAKRGKRWAKTVKKLLTDSRFDK
ncbi:MAG: hypothetical protein L6Q92_09405 [Phycisphaerae bacterium]|nr:hypothetical protein [Phycisphaerae bacterium]